MDFYFDDHAYNRMFQKFGIKGSKAKVSLLRVFILWTFCWLPMAILSMVENTFWTGTISTSFITNFDTQSRFFVALPLLMLAESIVGTKLGVLIQQFVTSGIVDTSDHDNFQQLVERRTKFLRSNWTDLVILLFCYGQLVTVFLFESENTGLLSWQLVSTGSDIALSMTGKWSMFIARPIVTFFVLKWLVRIIAWGLLLRKISGFKLKLYAYHPDLVGGLGFVGYSIRYFAPIVFALSVVVAGTMADLIFADGFHLQELRSYLVVYVVFITLLMLFPMFSFIKPLMQEREDSVFMSNGFSNGMYREMEKIFAKGHYGVQRSDLDSPAYSSVSDLNAVIGNALQMRFLPFTLKDLIPLWVMTLIPFLGVILIEMPVSKILGMVMSFLT